MQNTQQISRKNLHKFYVKVCSGWQNNIAKLLIEQQVEDQISIPNSLIEQAYNEADADVKKMLKEHFNLDIFQSIKDKVKTWDDVLKLSGKTEDEILPYKKPSTTLQKKLNAFAKLCLITEVLNEGWYPNWEADEYKYYNYWSLRGVFCFLDCFCYNGSSDVPSALCLKSEELARHAAKVALEEYKEFYS